MERIVVRVLIITSVCCFSKRHVYIAQDKTWKDAQKFCQDHFIDLSPITSELEETVFRETIQNEIGWIGLHRDFRSSTGWKWSGGEDVTYQNWNYGAYDGHDFIYWTNNGWESDINGTRRHFFCFNMTLVEQRHTWENAMQHCRQRQSNLSSLLSKTERLLVMREVRDAGLTGLVWTGLRYLGGSWLWVDASPLAGDWHEGGNQCPKQNRCGALNAEGEWVTQDCKEEHSFICH
ncbi:lithostathine-2-like [Lates japonicus]|uniref:Lithostathine-2-like protein n=1 Tax=Lates japonicus TaxID=270547 RepID=A0AAD3N1G6_LATJO|nr:lithostathine-2-like protein [Lates japonicus]